MPNICSDITISQDVDITAVGIASSKLSKLQKWIVLTALNKRAFAGEVRVVESPLGGKRETPIRLFSAEIKAGFYKLKFKERYVYREGTLTVRGFNLDELCERPGNHVFDTHDPRYRRACAAVSRAITRLEKRNLITVSCGSFSHWTAVELTDIGKRLALELRETRNG
jgi:hypothetical protein